MAEAKGSVQFTLKELAEIDDGRIAVCFEQAARRIAADLDDRPGLKKARTMTIQLTYVPIFDPETSLCDGVKMTCRVKDSIPIRESRAYDLGLRKGGILTYHPETPDNHEQEALFPRDSQ